MTKKIIARLYFQISWNYFAQYTTPIKSYGNGKFESNFAL